jgi:hypothetical protein
VGKIGAIAGLLPAGMWVILVVSIGALSGDLGGLAVAPVIAIAGVGIGWLAGPIARGSAGSDIRALLGYALLAATAYLIVGTVMSIATFAPGGEERSITAVVTDAIARFGYGLLYLPFWAAFVSPFALAWLVALRILRRRVQPSVAHADRAIEGRDGTRSEPARTRRLTLFAAVGILVYGAFVAALPLLLYDEPRPPWWFERPLALLGLFATPALIATLGAVRGVRPLLIAAGILCLLQAYVAFSGVTIGFVVPAILLLAMGASGRWPNEDRVGPSAAATGVLVIVLVVAAWVALFAFTAPRCWVGAASADGRTTTVEIPATEQQLHGPMVVPSGGGGCSSAELTRSGIAVTAVLAIGAIAVAAYAPIKQREPGPA